MLENLTGSGKSNINTFKIPENIMMSRNSMYGTEQFTKIFASVKKEYFVTHKTQLKKILYNFCMRKCNTSLKLHFAKL